MDIIIRNQDKTAVVKTSFVGYSEELAHAQTTYIYRQNIVGDKGIILGHYATKERCIEIVNDIYNEVIRHATDGESVFIYSMPKE